uniref:Uncharacterized protein n=1 Tax=viral metagenome TaxID=1070528 RepID=A0A6M3LHG0_9ZZZZ
MITGLLIVIVVLEIIRFVIYIQDSKRIRITNKLAGEQQARAVEFAKKQNADWKKIRALEIKELKQLAKESDTMKQIYDEWVEANKKPSPSGVEE